MTREITSNITRAAKILWDFHCLPEAVETSDILIALGSHDLRVAERAADIMLAGVAPTLVVTGGAGKVTTGIWQEPEADAYARVAIDKGVPDEAIVREMKSSNTTDNFTNSRALLATIPIEVTRGVIVSKPYMARRAMAVATKQWPDVSWGSAHPHLTFEEYPSDETPLDRMINLMVGDLQRLDVYAQKGFQSPQEIPPTVWAAYQDLVSAGFDDFVIRE